MEPAVSPGPALRDLSATFRLIEQVAQDARLDTEDNRRIDAGLDRMLIDLGTAAVLAPRELGSAAGF